MVILIILDRLTINIGVLILVVSDVLGFWLRMWLNKTNDIVTDVDYSLSNNVYHFGIKFGLIIILAHCFIKQKSTLLLISLTYMILSFFLFGIDEIFDIISKTTWSINILIVSTLISLSWYFYKRLVK